MTLSPEQLLGASYFRSMTNTLKKLILLTGMLLSLGHAAAQSKKEQIAALNNRVDSLYRVLSEERSDCAKALQTNA